MKLALRWALFLLVSMWSVPDVLARGASPYLPLNLSPYIERQVERVLILGGKAVIRRPIAAAVVFDALPEACKRDHASCEVVRRYLNNYMDYSGITSLRPKIYASSSDSVTPAPNQHGELVDSSWRLSASAYYQPSDYVILNVGGVAYEGEAAATGSFLSAGWHFAQIDIGFRDHWLSPLADSTSLIGTEAPTMPSVTVSNYEPVTRLGLNYEIFLAEMSKQEGIAFQNATTSGKPKFGGLQIGIEPASGFSFAVNRVVQYGGGARSKSLISQFFDQVLESSNAADTATDSAASNRVASLTSSLVFPGKIPMALRMEYAGEDNALAGNRYLGATNFSLGVDLPQLGNGFDFSLEVSEWQNDWYVHYLYPEGLTNRDRVVGHWFGDQRVFTDAIGGSSQMLRLGWASPGGNYWQATYRTMTNDEDWRRASTGPSYDRMHALSLSLSSGILGRPIEAELLVGQDVFADSFARLGVAVEFAGEPAGRSRGAEVPPAADPAVEYFVDAGVNYASVTKILSSGVPNVETSERAAAHLGIGVRRPMSNRFDLGARLEIDSVDDERLLSIRALDLRFRWNDKFAIGGFVGVGRYDVGLPAYGYYWGGGLQYRNILPNWDIGVDYRQHNKLGRDKTLPNDPPSTPDRTRMFFDVDGVALYFSRRW